MKEIQNQEVKVQQQDRDYFLYFSYIVMIAVIIFFYQNGCFAFIHNIEFTQIKHYIYAACLAIGIFFLLYNILTILGLALLYALFQFALHLLENSNI